HIPERDGVWMGLVLMEYMAKTGKTVSQLIEDMYSKVGSFVKNVNQEVTIHSEVSMWYQLRMLMDSNSVCTMDRG
ncbi:MAG: phosphoglucosamine mutase, partial [Bacteroidota bacterium]